MKIADSLYYTAGMISIIPSLIASDFIELSDNESFVAWIGGLFLLFPVTFPLIFLAWFFDLLGQSSSLRTQLYQSKNLPLDNIKISEMEIN